MRHVAGSLAAVVCAAALLAGCRDEQISRCLESNALRYAFHLPGDTTLVFHWPASRLPIRVYAEPVGDLPANVNAAMVLWANAVHCGEVTFMPVTDSTQADILMFNPPALPAVPLGAVSAAADSVGACRGRTDGQLDSANTLVGPFRSYVVPNTLDTAAAAACYHFTVAHELGHAIGLLSHSTNVEDLMYTVPRRPVVSRNDAFTLELLYLTPSTIGPPAP